LQRRGVHFGRCEVRKGVRGRHSRLVNAVADSRAVAVVDQHRQVLVGGVLVERPSTASCMGLAAQHHLPAMYTDSEFAVVGGLMSYGVSEMDNFRRAAVFVDKIFKGANPGDLAIEQPTKFELVINLKTAKSLGIIIPQSVLLRADEVIQ